jgi:DNA-binding SARP family transcriptional activator
VYQDDQPVTDWPSSKGKTIFKYMITHRERPIAKEILMDTFWPDTSPDAARNNLNVAIYGLRQALRKTRPSYSHIIFEYDSYMLNPELQIWVDYEAFFENLYSGQTLEKRGDLDKAMNLYSSAEALYQGEFIEEDRYEDWPTSTREHLREDYLDLLDSLSRYYFDSTDISTCTTMCRKILAIDSCREEAHRRLMLCYLRQGQTYLALRQYHLCEEALRKELDIPPMEETLALYQSIRMGERA